MILVKTAAGYIPPAVDIVTDDIQLGSGTITPEILSAKTVKTDHVYEVKFSAARPVIKSRRCCRVYG